MSVEDELDELRQRVSHLEDRVAIVDCIANHARGCDRHDVELLTSTYHDDGVDEHGRDDQPRTRIRGMGERGTRRHVRIPSAQHHDPHL